MTDKFEISSALRLNLDTEVGRLRAGRLLATAMLSLGGIYTSGTFVGALMWFVQNGWDGAFAALAPQFFQAVFLLACARLIAPLR